ncbi:MAG: GIY-YIG nuclease family protein [Candidatus Komeilibacteria bacterium]
MSKSYFVYLMTNFTDSVIYVGVTNDLERRVYEHKNKIDSTSFTTHYNIRKLVYYEETDDIACALAREKQIKGGSRKNKELLIIKDNPEYDDLAKDWYD